MATLDAALAPRASAWADRVRAIALTGQLPTLVCLGEHAPLAPAISWRDGRADHWAAERVDRALRMSMYARTGMPIDGRYLAPMLRFILPTAWIRCAASFLRKTISCLR